MFAIDRNRLEAATALINLKKFDVNEKVLSVSAIVVAWRKMKEAPQDYLIQKRHFNMILTLLKANSHFPSMFEVEITTDDIKCLYTDSQKIHELILNHDLGKTPEILEIIARNPKINHFYNTRNESAAFIALKEGRFDIFNLLGSKNVFISPTDHVDKICHIFHNLQKQSREKIQEIHEKNSRLVPEEHLIKLLINSFVSDDDSEVNERLIHVSDAYTFLDKIPWIQPLLELVSEAKKFEIFYDFNKESLNFNLN